MLILPQKIESIWFSVGLTPIFLGEKGALKKFAVQKGGPENFWRWNFLHQAPLTSVCEHSLKWIAYCWMVYVCLFSHLRRICTWNLNMFFAHLKIIKFYTEKVIWAFWNKLSEKLKNGIKLLVGQAVLELSIKTMF